MSEAFDYHVGIVPIETGRAGEKFAALFTTDPKRIFDYEDVTPQSIKKGYRGYVPWGSDNKQPYDMLEKIRLDEVMSSNMLFNINTAYGRGFVYTNEDGTPVTDAEVIKFFRRNNMIKFWMEQFTDIKHFYFSAMVIVLNNEGTKIVQIRHREAVNCRFETCNPKNGQIENLFYASWKDSPRDQDVEAYPLLDEDDPVGDLMVRMGIEPDPATGKKRPKSTDRVFAIVNRIPTPGQKYYPFPYYCATFNSGWYTLKTLIPSAKVARMNNGMTIKYMVELHKDYFDMLFKAENITDPKAKKERKKLEIENIRDFLSGATNQNKGWFSSYYIDPNGKEQRMVRIEVINNQKEDGEYIEDSEEAANIVSYAMGVHPSLIGSSPGKNKNINGTEARELFTMKQALEKSTRDLMLIPFEMINDVNNWKLKFTIPDLMLTTLDQGTDAVEASPNDNDKNKMNNGDEDNSDD